LKPWDLLKVGRIKGRKKGEGDSQERIN